MDEILKKLLLEEEELPFIEFNEYAAWQISTNLLTPAVTEHLLMEDA
jgi:hypothetical protein